KEGKDTIEFGINEYTTNLEWDSKNSNPAKVELTYADELLSGVDNIVSLQIVDSNGSPMFASRDMEFNLSVNDEKIIVPNKVTIKSGEYNSFFTINPQQSENSEISILASDFPLSKFQLVTTQTKPTLTISTVNSIEPGKQFDLVLDARIGSVPLSDLEIEWSVVGADIEDLITTTNTDGKIKLTLTPNTENMITIHAKTAKYGEISTEKQVTINTLSNGDGLNQELTDNDQQGLTNNLGFILIPGLAIGSGILIKKKNLLEPLSERFPIIDKVLSSIDELIERLEITERFSDIKEKIPIIKDR
ncbi:MAG: hypothetical protein R3327_07095, partial [Nitrosopumilaceae archaeon]|nr:hypothetical protein [Nitrosopumilaceae archaeon]